MSAALFAVALLTVLAAAPAAAHNSLTSSDPQDGVTLPQAPSEITLTFDDKVIEVGSLISVTAPDGTKVADGDIVIDRTIVTQQLLEPLPAGEYEVLWRITSADGHPIDGEFTFTTETAVGITEAATPPAAEVTETPEPAVTATEATTPAPPPDGTEGTADAADAESDGMSIGLLIAILVGVLILIAAVLVLVNKNRQIAQSDQDN